MTSQSTLRSLARSYANGTLDKDTYRKQRTGYIEAVLAGEVSLRPQQPPSAQSTQDTFAGGVTLKKSKIPEPKPRSNTDKQKLVWFVAGVGIVLLAIIVVLLIPDGQQQTTPIPSPSVTETLTPVPVPAETVSAAVPNLIKTFLTQNIWSETSMDTFVSDWNAIPDSEKAGISNTGEYSQLTSSIVKKLVEERALSTIGNPELSLEKQRLLVDFAARIGIQDSRIALPQQTIPETQQSTQDSP
jgi:hypothetical protein